MKTLTVTDEEHEMIVNCLFNKALKIGEKIRSGRYHSIDKDIMENDMLKYNSLANKINNL
jgi:hypothetical protein